MKHGHNRTTTLIDATRQAHDRAERDREAMVIWEGTDRIYVRAISEPAPEGGIMVETILPPPA